MNNLVKYDLQFNVLPLTHFLLTKKICLNPKSEPLQRPQWVKLAQWIIQFLLCHF
jgi:hypothetical protein